MYLVVLMSNGMADDVRQENALRTLDFEPVFVCLI